MGRELCRPLLAEPVCPVCGQGLGFRDVVYLFAAGVPAGCNHCMEKVDAGEWQQEQLPAAPISAFGTKFG